MADLPLKDQPEVKRFMTALLKLSWDIRFLMLRSVFRMLFWVE
jgi:hypothetical protein